MSRIEIFIICAITGSIRQIDHIINGNYRIDGISRHKYSINTLIKEHCGNTVYCIGQFIKRKDKRISVVISQKFCKIQIDFIRLGNAIRKRDRYLISVLYCFNQQNIVFFVVDNDQRESSVRKMNVECSVLIRFTETAILSARSHCKNISSCQNNIITGKRKMCELCFITA